MDKIELYDKAKDAYYNDEEIMTDLEFDELEKELGLENKGYVGTHHQKSYTVPHPFIMGSLSKVQIKKDEKHYIDWETFQNQVISYLKKSNGYMSGDWYFEVTPKYDGVSFEVVVDRFGQLISVSTRGDGNYGKDIKVWFEDEWKKNFKPKMFEFICSLKEPFDILVIRGECLVKKSVFEQKYASDFTLPRSFVSGVIGQDWEGTDKQKEMRKDLSWVCYDYREVYENGVITELDYTGKDEFGIKVELGERPGTIYTSTKMLSDSLYDIYDRFEHFRHSCEYALDGFVVKPGAKFRLQDGDRVRQEDCVAVKFLPEIVDAVLADVEWNVGKKGEYYPTGILEEIILGGKKVNRVSLANYGKIVKEGIGIGSKMKISLAGDIIPYVYKVETKGEPLSIPEDSYVDITGVHLMKQMSEYDKMYIKFLNSVKVLKPDGIGEAVAEKLFDINPVENILDIMSNMSSIKSELDDSKSSQNIITSLNERRKTLNLPDVIQSMGYENCGEKNALWLAKKYSGLNPDTKGIPTTIIELGDDSKFHFYVGSYVETFNLPLLVEEKSEGKIPVIMTGSPKACGFATKSDFLDKHPEYCETSKWGECQILFTDDLDSTSSKMEKAKKLGIEIRRYE